MKFDRELACWYAHSLEQQGFQASAYDTGERRYGHEICQIRVWVDGKIELIRNWFEYGQFRCKHILNARREHHQAISDLIDSVSDPGDDWRDFLDKLESL